MQRCGLQAGFQLRQQALRVAALTWHQRIHHANLGHAVDVQANKRHQAARHDARAERGGIFGAERAFHQNAEAVFGQPRGGVDIAGG